MKVALLISRFLDGGIDTVIVRYANGLTKDGHEVTMVISEGYGDLEVYKKAISKGVRIEYLVREGFLTSIAKKKLARRLSFVEKMVDEALFRPLRRLIQTVKMPQRLDGQDVVIDMDCMSHSFLSRVQKPKIAFFHFSIANYCHGKRKRIDRLGKKFSAYDKVVMVCNAMQEEASTLFPTLRGKFATIYNPQDIDDLRAKTAEYEVSAPPYILTVARLEESQKDYRTLLKAYKNAIETNGGQMPDLRIIGKGRDEHSLKSMALELGVADRVKFMGHIANPFPWFAKCEAFVLSSKFEGLAVTLVEALILKKPAVATDCPVGPAEVLDNGRCGILVPVGDVEAMSDALRNIAADKELVRKCVEQGSTHSKKFLWDEAAKRLYGLIDSIQ